MPPTRSTLAKGAAVTCCWVALIFTLIFLGGRSSMPVVVALFALAPLAVVGGLLGLLLCALGLIDSGFRHTAAVAFTAGVLGCCLWGMLVLMCSPPRYRARRGPTCQNNLKQIDLLLHAYASESEDGRYPPLSSEPGRLMFVSAFERVKHVYPEYFRHLSVLICPKDTDLRRFDDKTHEPERFFDDHSYFYLGYAVTNEKEMTAFARSYEHWIKAGVPFDENLPVAKGRGTYGLSAILRLREDLYNDIPRVGSFKDNPAGRAIFESTTPVLIERLDNHSPTGGNVLYLDGHVEFHRYPGEWPMTEATFAILEAMDRLGLN